MRLLTIAMRVVRAWGMQRVRSLTNGNDRTRRYGDSDASSGGSFVQAAIYGHFPGVWLLDGSGAAAIYKSLWAAGVLIEGGGCGVSRLEKETRLTSRRCAHALCGRIQSGSVTRVHFDFNRASDREV